MCSLWPFAFWGYKLAESSDRSTEPGGSPLSDQYSRTASDNDHLAIAYYILNLIYTIIIDVG